MSAFKKLYTNDQELVLNCILEVYEQAIDSELDDDELGVCHNLYECISKSTVGYVPWSPYKHASTIFEEWPNGSGSDIFPVPGEGYSVVLADYPWEGEQLEYRLDLLRYMFERLYNEKLDCDWL